MRKLASRLIGHLRANPIALAALFIALGTGAYAANTLPKNSVKSKTIKNGQVKTKDLARDAVDSTNIRAGAVKGPQIAAGAVGATQIEDGSIGVGELDPAAQPDKDLDLLRGQRVSVDDPADGVLSTTATLLSYGPFTIEATCQDIGASTQMQYRLRSTEHGWVNTSGISPDDFNAGENQPLVGGTVVSANQTTSSGGYALTDSGRFISLAIVGVSKPGGGADCLFHASGWGG